MELIHLEPLFRKVGDNQVTKILILAPNIVFWKVGDNLVTKVLVLALNVELPLRMLLGIICHGFYNFYCFSHFNLIYLYHSKSI